MLEENIMIIVKNLKKIVIFEYICICVYFLLEINLEWILK